MNPPLTWRRHLGLVTWLAWRELGANRTLTTLLVVATAAGVAFQIPNAANLAGYTNELLGYGITAGWGDVRVRPRNGSHFRDVERVVRTATSLPQVRAAVPALMLPAALGAGDRFLSLPVAGLDVPVAWPPYRVVAGGALRDNDPAGVLIGASAAEALGLEVGDAASLGVISTGGAALPLGADLVRTDVVVRGIVGGVFGAFDPVYVDRATLARRAGLANAASVIFVYAGARADNAATVAAALERALPEVSARPWMDDAPLLRASIEASAALGRISVIMVFFAVAVPIAALLTVAVLERRRELALLSAIGFSRRDVFFVTVLRALLVALAGCLVGALAGQALVVAFTHHPIFSWHSFVVRPAVSLGLLARSALLVLAAAATAALYPAWRAARMDPAPVLRDLA